MAQLLPKKWSFAGRRKRPPTDPVNALLSLGYTVLFNRVETACRAWGLDPALGIFHEYRPGRSSLACDLMEPFRTPVVDRLVLQMLRQHQFAATDFCRDERDNSITLTEDAFRRYLNALESGLHDGDLSLQTQLMDAVRRHCEQLPDWDGPWPTEHVLGTIFTASNSDEK